MPDGQFTNGVLTVDISLRPLAGIFLCLTKKCSIFPSGPRLSPSPGGDFFMPDIYTPSKDRWFASMSPSPGGDFFMPDKVVSKPSVFVNYKARQLITRKRVSWMDKEKK